MANKFLNDGVYHGSAKGMKGDLSLELKCSDNKITEVNVTDHSESYGIGYGMETTPVEYTTQMIVDTQGVDDIDVVTGASVTHNAIINAASEALAEAGMEIDATSSASQSQTTEVNEVEDSGKTIDYKKDVVVIGSGGAGLSAAIAGLKNKQDVLVLEKQSIIGGATSRSGGKLLAADTSWQEKEGIEDSAEAMYDYLVDVGGDLLNKDKVKEFAEHSKEELEWLESIGVKVQDVEPIHASISPNRVHNTLGGGGMTDGFGGQITVPLFEEFKGLGGEVLYDTSATDIMTENQKITGVKAKNQAGDTVVIEAPSVIIATGGYAQNPDMMSRYADRSGEHIITTVPDGNKGDGIKLAEKVGAKVFNNPSAQTNFLSFTSGVGINEEAGLIVNQDGKRVANEYTYMYHVGEALGDSGSNLGYYVATANDPSPTVQYAMTLEDTPSGGTIEEAAQAAGLNPESLGETVSRYNELAEAGEDTDFGKPIEFMYPVTGEKYYVIPMNPVVTVTYGGLETDSDSRVLDTNNQPIEGLYAAGEVAHTGLFGTEYPCCGMAISSGIYYGKKAGEHVASQKEQTVNA